MQLRPLRGAQAPPQCYFKDQGTWNVGKIGAQKVPCCTITTYLLAVDMSAEVRRHRPDVSVHIYIYIYTSTHTHIHAHSYMCTYIYIYIYTHVTVDSRTYTHTHVHRHTHTQGVNLCVCVYIYTYRALCCICDPARHPELPYPRLMLFFPNRRVQGSWLEGSLV